MLAEEIKKFSKEIKSKFYFDYDLKKKNWFNIGGKTKVYFKPESLTDLVLFIKEFDRFFSVISSNEKFLSF